jgi:hypothetical protein
LKAKYVMFTDNGVETGLDRVTIFDTIQTHSDVVRSLGVKPFSAGFISFGTEGIVCYGESFTLKLKSRSDDAERIKRLFSL